MIEIEYSGECVIWHSLSFGVFYKLFELYIDVAKVTFSISYSYTNMLNLFFLASQEEHGQDYTETRTMKNQNGYGDDTP